MDWDREAFPFNPRAKRGDPDYRPGPDWPPSLNEIAYRQGMTWEELAERTRQQIVEDDE